MNYRQAIKLSQTNLNAIDLATVNRVGQNHAAYRKGEIRIEEWAGLASVNVEELLEIIERLTRPAAATGTGWPA